MKARIDDTFWNRAIGLARNVILQYQWDALNDNVPGADGSGCLHNFRLAAGLEEGEFHGFVFQDSDLYKWLEAASFALASGSGADLEEKVDEAIALIAKAQEPDGYVNTYFAIKAPESKWANLREAHELYCAGHLIEAAVAHYGATGKKTLLDVAVKLADLIDSVFGHGKSLGYPGHEEVELALVKLAKATGETRYLDLAKHFISQRGSLPSYFDQEKKSLGFTAVWDSSNNPVNLAYHQAHLHPVDQDTAVGHAVRAMYLYSAMADLAAEDDDLLSACKKLYANVTKRQMYITGGVGSTPSGEAFTHDYDLPPDTAYSETCAAIGLMMFAKRMGDVTGEAKYYDTVERALYNGVLSGVSLSGREFFYVNPLSVHPGASNPERSHVKPVRQAWFPCACCPPNLSRTLLSLADYAVRISESAAYVNLFISGEYESGGKKVKIETQYPYSGKVTVTAWGGRFALKIRVPGQSRYQEEFRVWNGEATVLEFDVSPRILFSHPKLSYTRGMAAMCAGPLAYCAEEAGNSDSPDFFRISPDSVFELAETPKEFPAETKAYKTKASKLIYSDSSSLYTQEPPIIEEADLVLVPYHLWGNRGLGDMRVWLALE